MRPSSISTTPFGMVRPVAVITVPPRMMVSKAMQMLRLLFTREIGAVR